jgi:hypothetical protein
LAATEVVPEHRLSDLLTECNELIAILTAIIRKLRNDDR